MATYAFRRTRFENKEWGIVSGDSPTEAMSQVLGSHPKEHGVTYAFVYIPEENKDSNSDFSLEWPISTGVKSCTTKNVVLNARVSLR